jgi:hypothetical protein
MGSRLGRSAAGLAAILLLAAVVAGCGSANSSSLASLRDTTNSWIPGTPSLIELPGFRTIEVRASLLAAQRESARKRLLAQLAAARIAAQKRARDEARRRYEEARRKALIAYKAALAKAAKQRAEALAKLRKQQALRAKQLRELEAKLRVPVGDECKQKDVRNSYKCRVGRLPISPPKKKH